MIFFFVSFTFLWILRVTLNLRFSELVIFILSITDERLSVNTLRVIDLACSQIVFYLRPCQSNVPQCASVLHLKGPSQPPPSSMPSNLLILHGEVKSEFFFTIGCVPESMFNYL